MQNIRAILIIALFALCGATAAHAQTDAGLKNTLVDFANKQHFRLKKTKNPHAAFCRKMLSDLATGKNFEDPSPVASGEDALRHLKCKPARSLDEGSGNFTGYEYEMNENVDDGPEYVFVSKGPESWIKTVNEDTCVYYYPDVSGGRFEEDLGAEPEISFSGLINYKNAPYIVHGADRSLRIARFHADTKERLAKKPAALRNGANCIFTADK
ncbi:MAG: hypothetical protein EPN97_16085 [Alphaproteobacteria bacterium]|nr:MAG: hypothetical protein EPN97_16085 [Alphaproteobacteria bacterium]